MKHRKNLRLIGILSLLLCLTALLCACRGSDSPDLAKLKPADEAILSESGDYYFAGMVKNKDTYYVRALLNVPEGEPAEADYRYILLADEITAEFQEDGVVGAWSPLQYFTAKELADGYQDNKITGYTKFYCYLENGAAIELFEYNDYVEFDVTTGEIDVDYIDSWYLFGDLMFDNLTISDDGSWLCYGRISESGDSGGGHPFGGGSVHMAEDGSLVLYDEDGERAGSVILEGGMLSLYPEESLAINFPEYQVEELVFLRESDSMSFGFTQTEENTLPAPPVLISPWRFTGLKQLISDDNYWNGGYLYRERTEDGLSEITNSCLVSLFDEVEEIEEHIFRAIVRVSGYMPYHLSIEENAEHSARFTYPVYLLTWQVGEGENAHAYDAFFFMTDTHTYLYYFDTTPENREEMKETWYEVFGQLELMDP